MWKKWIFSHDEIFFIKKLDGITKIILFCTRDFQSQNLLALIDKKI